MSKKVVCTGKLLYGCTNELCKHSKLHSYQSFSCMKNYCKVFQTKNYGYPDYKKVWCSMKVGGIGNE